MDPGLAFHKALLKRLEQLTVPSFDAVPQGTSYPYVKLAGGISQNADALVERHDERFIFVDVWSESRGQEEVLSIMAEIDELLHDQKLTLDTGRVVSLRVESKVPRRDADGVTYTGRVTLRVMTSH